ncbi:GTP cyclohydrolase I [Actinidia rufa]|uniref:GTP cyclohydrolase 1 n=1 Tax=Actinidia rufa TaxID=165716 RepID=A0A7J0FL14_9ERIC|nr:GTP cyclohydrolase I [Actinidia rufa]
MGALNEGRFNVELENGVTLGGCIELGLEREPETVAIEDAVKVLLQGLGEDINREGLRKTPLRVAKALREGTRDMWTVGLLSCLSLLLKVKTLSSVMLFYEGTRKLMGEVFFRLQREKVKDIVQGALFPEAGLESGIGYAGGAGGLVVVRDLDLFSYCESCLLPFLVKCHIGTVSSQQGVAVVLQCSHIHFPSFESAFLESNHHGWAKVLVSSGSGVFANEKADIWGNFLSLLKFRAINVEKIHLRDSADKCWCPSQTTSKIGPANSGMTSAVVSILRSLGEDPSRKELIGTPTRFVKWLMNFKNSNLEMKLNGIHLYTEAVNPIGKSLLQSIVHFHGFKLQVQERLTRQIAETASSLLGGDVMVVVEAHHTCMVSRGIEKFGSNTATVAVLGRFSTDQTARAKFLQTIPNSTTAVG